MNWVARLCKLQCIGSVFAKHRVGVRQEEGPDPPAGPPVHDYPVNKVFTADAPNRLWPTGITEHHTGEGKPYLCALKEVYSGRIVGYSIATV